MMSENKKNITTVSKDQCNGCMACLHSCPTKCIHTEWVEGFEFPAIDDDQCTNCGNCIKSCPVLQQRRTDLAPRVVGAFNKNEEIRTHSSSGGVFYELGMKVLKNKGVVCGAGFDDNMRVIHKIVEDESGISDLMRSKYVQSSLEDCFPIIKDMLIGGGEVLFVGTPCQVNGLYAYLGGDYPNLLLVDLICHGVPSPQIWAEFLRNMESRYDSKCQSASFRDISIEGWHNFGMHLSFANGETYVDTQNNNPYMKGFLYGFYDRKSCYDCQFKGLNRRSDITLGDFWSVKRYLENFDDNKGTSLIFINSEKGQKAFDSVQDNFEFKILENYNVLKFSGAYTNSEIDAQNREIFYAEYLKGESPFDILDRH